jgi:hypothetical protein
VGNDFVHSIDQNICEIRRFKISELSCELPQISRILLYEIITVELGYYKFRARSVLKMLTRAHKGRKWLRLLYTFLQRHHKDGDEFLNHIVRITGD